MIGLFVALAGIALGTFGISLGRKKEILAATVTGGIAAGIGALGLVLYYATQGRVDATVIGVASIVVGGVSIALAQLLRPKDPFLSAPVGAGRTNGLALASVIVVWFSSVIGLVLGHIALNQIKVSGEGGRGMALTAVVVGWIATALSAVVLIYFIAISSAAIR